MEWGPIIAAVAPEIMKGVLGGIAGAAEQKGQLEVQEAKNEALLEQQRLADQASMERLLEELGVKRETIEAQKQAAAVEATSRLTQQALANIPDAYKTLVEAILQGRGQEQSAFANLAASSQRAAMGK